MSGYNLIPITINITTAILVYSHIRICNNHMSFMYSQMSFMYSRSIIYSSPLLLMIILVAYNNLKERIMNEWMSEFINM